MHAQDSLRWGRKTKGERLYLKRDIFHCFLPLNTSAAPGQRCVVCNVGHETDVTFL